MVLALSYFAVLKGLLGVWLFAVGGAIGSFLNVVVYRLPAGMSIVHPGSHCPACKHPIRWFDNLPVVSWFLLRGRCRDCGADIAARYPLVEALVAALFLAVGAIEGYSLGANLPPRPVAVVDSLITPPMRAGEAAGIVTYHLLLVCTLLAAALVEYDGRRLPWRLAVPAGVAGWLAPLAWPYLHPVPAVLLEREWLGGLVDGSAGLALGLVIGLVCYRWIGGCQRRTLAIGPAAAGLFLGYQAVAVLGAAVLGLHLAAGRIAARWPVAARITPGLWWVAGTLLWILAWRALVQQWPLLGWFPLVDGPRGN